MEEEEGKEDSDDVSEERDSKSKVEASCEKTAGDSNKIIRKDGVEEIAVAIDGRKTAVLSTLESEEPEKKNSRNLKSRFFSHAQLLRRWRADPFAKRQTGKVESWCSTSQCCLRWIV